MKTPVFRISLLLCCICAAGSLLAQETSGAANCPDPLSNPNPRIGLVLGGGGARGAAHIGVLQELERMRVPIHAIAGTSMGAIVGGLYASGMTPDELEELVHTLDWADAFRDDSKRQRKSFRRKQDDAAFPIQFEMGVDKDGLKLPKGLIQGQKLQLILREQLLPVSDVKHFDDLPIKFRAVASDIATGDEIVMQQGDLAVAIRASMSAPGVFAPVEFEGHTLVDGGLVGNVPVDVAREMGVDVIIAVDVEFPLYEPEQLQSALAITEQMLTILIRKETLRRLDQLCPQDILIRPELGGFGSTNFEQIAEAIEPGVEATSAKSPLLAEFSLTEDDYRQFLASRAGKPYSRETIDAVIVSDDGTLSPRVLESRIKTEAGDTVDPQVLAADAERLYGLDTYEQVSYKLTTRNEETHIDFEARPKSWGPNFMQFGLGIEDDFDGSTVFNFATRLTMTGLNPLGAEWRNDLQLGTEPYLKSEFYQPLSFDSRYFVAPHIDLEQRNLNAFVEDDNVARYRISEGSLGLDVGRELGRWGEIRIGVFRGVGDARVKVGAPTLENFDYETGGGFARFSVDTLDDAQIPHDGTRMIVEWIASRPGFGADSRFDTLDTTFEKAWSWGKNTIQAGAEFATTVESDDLVQNFFQLGGFLRLSGLESGAISGPHAGLLRLMYYRVVGDSIGGLFDTPLYLGGSLEAGNVWQTRSEMAFDSMLINGSIFAGIDTYFGLLFLAAGFAEHGESNFYLFLGNPRRL
ncbi:MAG: NTE family protein [Woeseiaceae bacterium]|jgi:NTE family protein